MPLKRGLGSLAFRPGAEAMWFQAYIQGHKCPCSLQMISNTISLSVQCNFAGCFLNFAKLNSHALKSKPAPLSRSAWI